VTVIQGFSHALLLLMLGENSIANEPARSVNYFEQTICAISSHVFVLLKEHQSEWSCWKEVWFPWTQLLNSSWNFQNFNLFGLLVPAFSQCCCIRILNLEGFPNWFVTVWCRWLTFIFDFQKLSVAALFLVYKKELNIRLGTGYPSMKDKNSRFQNMLSSTYPVT